MNALPEGESVRCVFTYATTRLRSPFLGRGIFYFDGAGTITWTSKWTGTYQSVAFTDINVWAIRSNTTTTVTPPMVSTSAGEDRLISYHIAIPTKHRLASFHAFTSTRI